MIKRKKLRCSFCGKSEDEVVKLVAGPRVYICDKCVASAKKIMDEEADDDTPPPKAESSIYANLVSRTRQFFARRRMERALAVARLITPRPRHIAVKLITQPRDYRP